MATAPHESGFDLPRTATGPGPRSVELIFLGTGTSAGVPVIGCDCDTCRSDDPRDQRMRCSAAIRFTDAGGAERVILIDTSPDLRRQALDHDLRRCDAIFYTHNHVDHTFGLDETRRFNALMQSPITVHADRHTMEHLHRVYEHIFRRERNVNDSFVATLIPHVLEPERPIDLHGLRWTPLPLLHGRLPVLGFRVDAIDGRGRVLEHQPAPLPLAWCTDVSGIPPGTWPKLTGLRTLALDMLRERHHPTHFNLADALAAAERIEAGTTWFIHMTHDLRHGELEARLPTGVRAAWDGLVLGGTGDEEPAGDTDSDPAVDPARDASEPGAAQQPAS